MGKKTSKSKGIQVRDRIKEFRRVKASELQPNPMNFRRHSKHQRKTLSGIFDEVGLADAVIAYEEDGQLMMIDGHLRQDMLGDQEIPVLVLDVDREEALKILATFDPITGMAHTDTDAIRDLLNEINVTNESLNEFLSGFATETGATIPTIEEIIEDNKQEIPEIEEEMLITISMQVPPETALQWYGILERIPAKEEHLKLSAIIKFIQENDLVGNIIKC